MKNNEIYVSCPSTSDHKHTTPADLPILAAGASQDVGRRRWRCQGEMHFQLAHMGAAVRWATRLADKTRDLFRSSESFFFEPTTPTFAPPSHTHTHYPCARSHISPFLPTPFFCPSQVVVR
jgi:hypothetical protein